MADTVHGRAAARRAAWLALEGSPKEAGSVRTRYVSAVCSVAQSTAGADVDVSSSTAALES
jgi:hypothetical protein